MNILVRAPNWIGDQILAYPFFYELRRQYPQARIVSACVPWVADLQFRRQVDDVIVLPKATSRDFSARLEAVSEASRLLKDKGPWDLAISLPNSISSAWMLYRSGAKERRGYKTDGRGILFNQAQDWRIGERLHRADAYLKLLPQAAPFGAGEFWPQLPDGENDAWKPGVLPSFDAPAEWPGVEWLEPPQEAYWVLAPGATAESRRWPIEYFVSLASSIAQATGMTGVIVGGPKEIEIGMQLTRDKSLKLVDFTAEGPVPSLWRLFAQAKFAVTNESGLAHVASLCGAFTQIVCGAADPKRTRPLGPGQVQVAVNPIECWPCEKNVCQLRPPDQKLSCLLGIQPVTVWEEIQRGIRRTQNAL